MAHRILYLAKATRGSRDARSARQDYKLASREIRFCLTLKNFTALLSSSLSNERFLGAVLLAIKWT